MRNLIWFQLGWWSLVLSASKEVPVVGLAATAILIPLHFYISENKKRDLIILFSIGSLGLLGDSLLIHFGFLYTPKQTFPWWLAGMWLLFPLTLPYSFNPLISKLWALPFVAIAAAGSYYSGTVFKILYFQEPLWLSIVVASGFWLIYLISTKGLLLCLQSKSKQGR